MEAQPGQEQSMKRHKEWQFIILHPDGCDEKERASESSKSWGVSRKRILRPALEILEGNDSSNQNKNEGEERRWNKTKICLVTFCLEVVAMPNPYI